MILWSYLAFLVSVVGLMLSPNLIAAAGAMIALGGSIEMCRIATLSLMQISVPDALRGRVLSLRFLLNRLATTLGVAVVGVAGDHIGLRLPILVIAAAGLIIWAMTHMCRHRISAAFAAEAGGFT